MSKIIERINNLRNELNKETENLKTELATNLEAAAVTFEILKQLGVTVTILNEKPFAKFVSVFGCQLQVPTGVLGFRC